MLCILHGWLLEGSGSNLWTRSVVRSLCRMGETVHLVCQENHPGRYDFVATAVVYRNDGEVSVTLSRETPYPGKCTLHQPELDGVLPVFVWDKYDEHSRVVPMVDLPTPEIESYIDCNVRVVERIVDEFDISVIHANHAVLMPTVAQKVSATRGTPFTVMPHGSDIEYAVKKDERFLDYANSALDEAQRIFVIGDEMRERVRKVFTQVPQLESKLTNLHLGVDTSEFEPVERTARMENIDALLASLSDLPKGKTEAQESGMRKSLPGVSSLDELRVVLAAASRYDGKLPDHNAEARLRSVPWTTSPTLLFVGRLIAWKGIQSLVAALPLVVKAQPGLRTIIVGHGPLREAMEAFVWALATGRRDVVEMIVHNGITIEGGAKGSEENSELDDVLSFYTRLESNNQLEHYFEAAREFLKQDSVVFTGYLTHTELRHLFPCCDVGVFPSVVREAGPLVFLEALASGCFPLGTYFGGMAASIDAVGEQVSPDIADLMKLDPSNTVDDLARKIPAAIEEAAGHGHIFAKLARERYDWSSVSRRFLNAIEATDSTSNAIS